MKENVWVLCEAAVVLALVLFGYRRNADIGDLDYDACLRSSGGAGFYMTQPLVLRK